MIVVIQIQDLEAVAWCEDSHPSIDIAILTPLGEAKPQGKGIIH